MIPHQGLGEILSEDSGPLVHNAKVSVLIRKVDNEFIPVDHYLFLSLWFWLES
jgi:hypothetical protein